MLFNDIKMLFNLLGVQSVRFVRLPEVLQVRRSFGFDAEQRTPLGQSALQTGLDQLDLPGGRPGLHGAVSAQAVARTQGALPQFAHEFQR